jgi:hypothetical protein
MASGILGSIAISSANSWQQAYPVPSNTYSVFNVSFTNTNATSVTIKLAVAATTSPASNEVLEFQTTVVGYGVFERTGLVANNGAGKVMVQASATGVNVNVYGIETSTS